MVVNKKTTFLVRLDAGWREILFAVKKRTGRSVKSLIEEVLGDAYQEFCQESAGDETQGSSHS